YGEFQDWGLALLAYNVGERRLREAIQETGSRDPWKLIESGVENDGNYLARVMAVILILRNPKILD
ncbi:MAG: hypothetical protein KDD22_05240, partial [Bdellovibrionales bacterium]|nr:hypothetical protein [Bdellovibrionales bacterium]